MQYQSLMNYQLIDQFNIVPYLSKKAKLPAKQLIKKQYSPDIKPIIKYITLDQINKKQTNIKYIPPKIKNQEFQEYAAEFHIGDYLGYEYKERLDQMVYFRYNNGKYNGLRVNKKDNNKQSQQNSVNSSQKITKFFSGLFISLSLLSSKTLKQQQNLFTSLSIPTPELKQSICQSFSKNSKGCSLDPLFSSNYHNANLLSAIRVRPYQYDLIIQSDINTKTSEYFNFAIKFIEEGLYKFNIVNLSTKNSDLYENGMRIPCYSYFKQSFKKQTTDVKTGDGWGWGGENVKISKSQIRKQTQPINQTYYCLSFQYKCKSRQEIVVFANSFPYSSLDYERFLNRVILNKIGNHMKMQKMQIGQTVLGQKMFGYLFYHRKSRSNTILLQNLSSQKFQTHRSLQRHRTMNLHPISSSSMLMPLNSFNQHNQTYSKSIIFLCRQHSGSSTSSFTLQGIIQFIMYNGQFDNIKKNYQFIIIPFINLDGMTYGNQRTNITGIDLKNVWRQPNQMFQSQICHVKKFLKKVNQKNMVSMIVNLEENKNCLSAGFKTVALKSNTSFLQKEKENTMLFPYMCSKRIQQISFQNFEVVMRDTLIMNSMKKNSCLLVLSEMFPKALVYEFNCSSYGWKVQSNFRRINNENIIINNNNNNEQNPHQSFDQQPHQQIFQFTPDKYRSMGKQLLSTYMQYIRLCDKNIGIKQRWQRQIQLIPENMRQRQLSRLQNQRKYQQVWQKELIKYDYNEYMIVKEKQKQKQKENNFVMRNQKNKYKHKTMVIKQNQKNLGGGRSGNKKVTMSFLKPIQQSNDGKENQNYQIGKLQQSHNQPSQQLSEYPSQRKLQFMKKTSTKIQQISSSFALKQTGLQQLKKSPSTLSSNLFNPIGRNNFLEQISKTIKKQAQKQQTQIINTSNSVQMTLKNQKEKRMSKYLAKYRDNQYKQNKEKDNVRKGQEKNRVIKTPVIKEQEDVHA